MELDVTELTYIMMAVMVMLLAEHLALWRRIGPPWSYILGVGTFGLPLTVLWLHWGNQQAATSFWAVVVAGGLAVWCCYDVRLNLEVKTLRAEIDRVLNLVSDFIITLRKTRGDANGEEEC